jgi:Transposase DDE domain
LDYHITKETVLPMKVETFVGAILSKMSDITKCQFKFIPHVVRLFLSIRGRLTYLNLERHGDYCEQSFRINYEKTFDFKSYNTSLIQTYCGDELIWIFDPSYLAKSGKHTPGTGYFWSGCAGAMKWGLELSALAIGDIDNHTAMHYHVTQTQAIKGEESLRMYYAKLLVEQAEELQKLSKILAVDAFFSKKPFVDSICAVGFTIISRLQNNIHLRYAYTAPTGEKRAGRGRPQEYDGKIDSKNVSLDHFTLVKSDETARIYEGIAHVRCLKRWGKIVIVHYLKEDGTVRNVSIYYCSDKKMAGLKVYQYYRLRYQIEFLFRDAKGHLGLEHSQSRQEKAIDFHCNMALTTLNTAKAMHWFDKPKAERPPFSMADIKTQYVNEQLLDRLIIIYGKDPSVEINNPEIKKLYQLGRIAA